MKRVQKLPRLIWWVPLWTVVVVGLIFFAGGSRVTKELVKRHLAETYGLSEAQIEKLSFELPGGWDLPLEAILNPPPHDHPLPPSFSVVDTGISMVFAHMGDGKLAGTQSFKTTFILVNDSKQDASGTIEFYDNDGNPLELTLEGVTASSFDFTLKAGEVKRFVTSGTGQVKSGWAHVHSDQPIGGTASFGIRTGAGQNELTSISSSREVTATFCREPERWRRREGNWSLS